jgi:hypothetical protein
VKRADSSVTSLLLEPRLVPVVRASENERRLRTSYEYSGVRRSYGPWSSITSRTTAMQRTTS